MERMVGAGQGPPEHRAIIVVGAGAAGLTTAIACAEECRARGLEPPPVLLLEGARRIGAKILVSGGGRCNVTHRAALPDDYHASRPVIRNVLREFSVEDTVAWFASLGVELKEEQTGKLFPVTDSARTVVAALVERAEAVGVEIRTGARVREIRGGDGDDAPFRIELEDGELTCDRLALATGGRSLPKSGSDGAGYAFARALGHTVTDTWPALVPLLLDPAFPHAEMSGISHRARLTVRVAGRQVEERTGDLLWTHFGISGPVAMDISRTWIAAAEAGETPRLELCFTPDFPREAIETELLESARRSPVRTIESWLSIELPRRLARWILARADLPPRAPIAQIPRAERRRLLDQLDALPLPVTGPRGWNMAEVTAGGVPLAEIDHRTFASRRRPGLHLVGEILDCDGRIGGFNFQWAWAGGHLAGRALARSLPTGPIDARADGAPADPMEDAGRGRR
ncbi:MAG: BaiN/RdsA family NAD(P)/FAD-dependent oxidoreductase [Planctomycetota bacterium]|jgi:predicted Rossmann fold flavoprotein